MTDVSFSASAGEILGVAGLVGSGRTELAETLFGLRLPTPARFTFAALVTCFDRLPKRFAQDSRMCRKTGADTASSPISAWPRTPASRRSSRISVSGFLRRQAERDLAAQYISRFRIRTPSTDTEAGLLSGGNQQKVALARWLATSPSILILDEPTQGVDVGAKAEIHALMRELAAEGWRSS